MDATPDKNAEPDAPPASDVPAEAAAQAQPVPDAPRTVGVKKKIAILGTTPTRMQAPIDDPEWEIWTIGPGGKDHHLWDVLWEVHHVWPENFKDYLRDLSLVKPPQQVVTLRPAAELINNWLNEHGATPEARQALAAHVGGPWEANVIYPSDAILDRFFRRMWFSSSISYCIAAAMERRPTDIGLFGIDLESGEEYIAQFQGAAHLIDVARHMGINIHMPSGCGLERDIAPYPTRYETNLALTFEKKHQWLSQAVAHVEQQFKEMEANLYRQEGANMAMESMKAPEEHLNTGRKNLEQINVNLAALGANFNHLKGELSATQFYRRMFVWGVVDPD